jgi:hypothetical protein
MNFPSSGLFLLNRQSNTVHVSHDTRITHPSGIRVPAELVSQRSLHLNGARFPTEFASKRSLHPNRIRIPGPGELLCQRSLFPNCYRIRTPTELASQQNLHPNGACIPAKFVSQRSSCASRARFSTKFASQHQQLPRVPCFSCHPWSEMGAIGSTPGRPRLARTNPQDVSLRSTDSFLFRRQIHRLCHVLTPLS